MKTMLQRKRISFVPVVILLNFYFCIEQGVCCLNGIFFTANLYYACYIYITAVHYSVEGFVFVGVFLAFSVSLWLQ